MAACSRNNIRMLLVNKSDLGMIAEVQALLGSGECLPWGLPGQMRLLDRGLMFRKAVTMARRRHPAAASPRT